MALLKICINILLISAIDALIIKQINYNETNGINEHYNLTDNNSVFEIKNNPEDVFNGVYTECILYLSYTCLQKRTLAYLKQLSNMSEITVFGDYMKFVKFNTTEEDKFFKNEDEVSMGNNSEKLSELIDKAIDSFFGSHQLRFKALGRDLPAPTTVDEFVGRKKRKGGGGDGGGGIHDDGGKKKMMMMAMMVMKMKCMMVVPAMMGMMGMMSFKGMMFSMMSFMMSKMMLLMKILEKKGGFGGGGGGGGDGGWAAGGGGGGGGAWMPAGGQDYGGGGGGYDANGQWQSRSIYEYNVEEPIDDNKPIVSYVRPVVSYNNQVNEKKPKSLVKNLSDEIIKIENDTANKSKPRSRQKRGVMEVIQNAYLYWLNKVLGFNSRNKYLTNYPKYRVVNGVKYVYYPYRNIQKPKTPKAVTPQTSVKTVEEGFKPIIIAEDFNKGEIVEGPVESRMHKKKFDKMKDTLNETLDEDPWQ